MTQNERYSSPISEWMAAVIANGGIERFDDLHIDKIDPIYAQESMWLQGGLDALTQATKLIADHGPNVIVALAFSLKSSEHRRGANFSSEAEFSHQIDWSPPSLYIFWRMHEPWMISYERKDVKVEPISTEKIFGVNHGGQYCSYLIEFEADASNEYYRTVYVAHCL